MLSNRLAFVALGIFCVAAAAGGGYIATRQNAAPPAGATTSTAPATTPDRPVQETEAVVGDPGKISATPPTATTTASSPKTTPAKRETTRSSVTQPSKTATVAKRQDAPPSLDRTWPSSASSGSSQSAASTPTPAPVETPASPVRPEERAAAEPPRAPEPPPRTFEELVVSADSVIGLQTENRISSETARVEDRVEARVTRDVKVGDRVAIPAGSRAIGSVMLVERGGKFKERARLGIRFNQLVLADGTRLALSTETIYRDGEAPGSSSASKIGGGAVGGAILGAILGGAKGAAIGATAGAGGGAAVVAAGDRSAATLAAGTPMTVRILAPISVTTEK